MFVRNALLPLIAKLMSAVARPDAASVTTISGVYVPCPPITALAMTPVALFSVIPSGNGGVLPLLSTENV